MLDTKNSLINIPSDASHGQSSSMQGPSIHSQPVHVPSSAISSGQVQGTRTKLKISKGKPNLALGTGRRKTSIARVFLHDKAGRKILVNQKPIEEFFKEAYSLLAENATLPLRLVNLAQYDIKINVHGGGFNGQSDAIRHGIARALVNLNPEYKSILKDSGVLTRDSRSVESKKAGHYKARKSYPFVRR